MYDIVCLKGDADEFLFPLPSYQFVTCRNVDNIFDNIRGIVFLARIFGADYE
jgi:hypothetical protein